MISFLATQTPPLTEIQRAVRDHFQKGGSFGAIAVVVLVVVLGVIITYVVTRRLRTVTKEVELDSPGKLFQEMLLKLQLPVVERHVLATVAKDLHLEHPAAMLISSVLFDRHVGEWRSDGRGSGVDAKLLAQSRQRLFSTSVDLSLPERGARATPSAR